MRLARLGTGCSGHVRLGTERGTGQKVAVKSYSKAELRQARYLTALRQEVHCYLQLDHPHIVRLLEARAGKWCKFVSIFSSTDIGQMGLR